MLLRSVLLTTVVAATAYAGPCKPVTTRATSSLSSNPPSAPTTVLSTATSTGSFATEPTTESTAEQTSDATGVSTVQSITIDTTALDSTATEASSTPATTSAGFCKDNSGVITELAFDPAASPFCVSYLSMSTHTITEYQTIDPTNVYQIDLTTVTADAVTHIETGYNAVTVIQPEYTTKIEWFTDTVTSTRSIETITCLDTAYTYTTPVPTIERGNPPLIRREQEEVEVPTGLPADWTEAQTSDLCSCLEFDAPTTVTTVAQTVEPTTFVTASTNVVTPIEEYTKIITTTAFDVVTSTVTEKKTSTVTAWVVETTFADNNDIAYRRFNCPFNANIYDDGFTTAYFKGKNPLSSGFMQNLEFSTCSNTMTLAGSDTFAPHQAALVINAYFYAKETGTFTFTIPDTIDNWGYLWLRDAAYSWNPHAWAIEGKRTGSNAALWRGGSYQIQLKKGDAIPFTYLWANGGGCAGNNLSVRTPSGSSISGMRGSTVKACNVGKFA
ncbi:hypothetical protein FLONG3_2807 [Fusarium longipes]|uniref:PA14 domain-containing protein n=1 Tax=Fusarium longipes TaxID=694270 RepID=A0A395T3J3_9HYPO|nr:hypothetical protein FLONG3_2807 [Fusarium longipes]